MSKDFTTLHAPVPNGVADGLMAEASVRHISVEEVAAERIVKASPEVSKKSAPNYSAFFGVAKGRPGAFGSVEKVDRYIAELRSEW